MNPDESCIVRHFNQYYPLSAEDKALLFRLEDSATTVKAGFPLWEERDRAHEFCTLKRGWAFSYRELENGTRQILDIYLPGDIVGLREFAFSQRLAGVQMIEDGEVCFFPHRHLVDIFRQSFTLTSILFAIASRQQVMLTERLVNLARRNARQKLAHFLLEMCQRIKQTHGNGCESFRLPLSQEILADLLGLSPVHVSRTFTALNDDGLIFRERYRVTIPDLEALKHEAGFDDRYLIENMRPLFDGSPT
ncbi:Crp/Fnr family transcriptional regulator [Halomonas sp. MCCC 1A17488]|uniref:Crp/Fnr family transcriptional regulator n=1 Tax=Billgrantia sulfidoxydans TaxID=2733484 RepID=A0ABX7W6X6_9GAMM|nr:MULTISPECIES: Crp/Fnr family transcriptional regulator [Halomonas]MCE8014753.1 Crp/Fnr family transcriptional regulator [Halomonas sp. MCCC 1A17488]MCG3238086.1 Crp/Fnr family transcriptional regulator [Halomonas sp. MCCC 1A17488]QPP48140.1 Crp/Fnr family transcriptional regulator [Halomonas sp. SS10-MC5]QTP55442.1 Crp/Fnr family transcriptional regulator [Halomonas sulfidoxydans]